MSFHEFMDQYYAYITTAIFLISYTGLIVSEVINDHELDLELCLFGFLIVGFLSAIWFVILPILILILIVFLYIKLISWIAKIYKKRSES